MGYDAGCDFIPDGEDINERWETFLEAVRSKYKSDENVVVFDHPQDKQGIAIAVNLGEVPVIPFRHEFFKTFTSKISGRCGQDVDDYIQDVYAIGCEILGEKRVRYWNELNDEFSLYSWNEIYKTDDERRLFMKRYVTKNARSSNAP